MLRWRRLACLFCLTMFDQIVEKPGLPVIACMLLLCVCVCVCAVLPAVSWGVVLGAGMWRLCVESRLVSLWLISCLVCVLDAPSRCGDVDVCVCCVCVSLLLFRGIQPPCRPWPCAVVAITHSCVGNMGL